MDDIDRILAGGEAAAPASAPSDGDTLLVSKKVLAGADILFVYRDEADAEGDSGWTLLAGDESDAQMADMAFFEVKAVGWAVDSSPGLASILAAPADSSFERDAPGSPWVELVDD